MTPEDRAQAVADAVAAMQPIIDRAVSVAVSEAVRRAGLVRSLDGTIVDVDGRFCVVQPAGGEGEDELIHATRTWGTQVEGDEVVVLFVPPAGAFAFGRLPAPTEDEA